MQCMADIKCVQDIDAAGRRQYGANLLDMLNEQATVRGDLTPRRNEAATVPDGRQPVLYRAWARCDRMTRHGIHPVINIIIGYS
jgi:hypothetical protein